MTYIRMAPDGIRTGDVLSPRSIWQRVGPRCPRPTAASSQRGGSGFWRSPTVAKILWSDHAREKGARGRAKPHRRCGKGDGRGVLVCGRKGWWEMKSSTRPRMSIRVAARVLLDRQTVHQPYPADRRCRTPGTISSSPWTPCNRLPDTRARQGRDASIPGIPSTTAKAKQGCINKETFISFPKVGIHSKYNTTWQIEMPDRVNTYKDTS